MSGPSDLELRVKRSQETSNLHFDLMKRVYGWSLFDGSPGRRFKWDSYLNGGTELHLHFDAIGSYCATYRAKAVGFSNCEPGAEYFDGSCRLYEPMLISVRNAGERGTPIDSVIRLHSLNRCEMRGIGNKSDGSPFAFPELVFRHLKGKLDIITAGTAASRKLIDQIIKRSPEIVAGLPNKDADLGCRVGEEGLDWSGLVGRIGIELYDNGFMVDLSELSENSFQLRKVFACPIDPFKCAIEWVRSHGPTLASDSISA